MNLRFLVQRIAVFLCLINAGKGMAKDCRWEFDEPKSTEGWSLHGLESKGVTDGVWRLTATLGTPQMFTPKTDIDASNQPVVTFRMKLGKGLASNGCLLFITDTQQQWNDNTVVTFPCESDGKFHEYEVDMMKNPLWKGKVLQIRFQPIYVGWPIPDEQRAVELDCFRVPDIVGASNDSADSSHMPELIPNGGLEDIDSNGNPVGWNKFCDDPLPIDVAEMRKSGNPSNSLVSNDAYAGKHSLWINIPAGKEEIGGWAVRIPMKPRTAYRFSCRARKGGGASAGIAVNEFKADGTRTAQQTPLVASDQWQQYSLEFESQPETTAVQIAGYIWIASGQAWFDDFSLREIDLASLAAAKPTTNPTPFDQLTSAIVTPHIPWAVPYVNSPIKVLALPRHREVVELAQRLSIEYTAWSRFDTVDQTPGNEVMDRLYYGPRERGLSASLVELKRYLSQPQDVILIGQAFWPGLSGVFDWKSLPEPFRNVVLGKVKRGAGLVFVRPPADAKLEPFMETRVDTPMFLSVGIPFAGLTVLDRDVQGKEWLKCYTCGNGRVAIVDFQNETFGSLESERSFRRGASCPFTPDVTYDYRAKPLYYDYYQSLLAKLVLWAGHKVGELSFKDLHFDGGTLNSTIVNTGPARRVTAEIVIRDPDGNVEGKYERTVELHPGEVDCDQQISHLKSGPHFADLWLKQDGEVLLWGSAYFVTQAVVEITALETTGRSFKPGDTIDGKVLCNRNLPDSCRIRLQVLDSLGRLLSEQIVPSPRSQNLEFHLKLLDPVAIVHTVKATLLEGEEAVSEKTLEITCRKARRPVEDFQFWFWANQYNNDPVSWYILQDLHDRGFDVAYCCKPQFLAQKEQLAGSLSTVARTNLEPALFITGELAVSGGGYDSSATVRPRCFTSKAFRENLVYVLRHQASVARDYPMVAYSLGDENGIGLSGQDFCFSPTCQEFTRNYLKGSYGDLAALNAEWGASFASWEQVKCMTLAEAKQHGNFAPWADLRMAMEAMFTGLLQESRTAIRESDPEARVGTEGPTSGTMYKNNGEDSFLGYDFGKILPEAQMWGVYFQHYPQIEYVRSFASPDSVRFTFTQPFEDYPDGYYEDRWQNEQINQFVPWYDLFHGLNAIQYWDAMDTKWYGFYSHDLRPTPWGDQIVKTMREIKGGVGRLLLACRRANDRIAIHYSPASFHAQIILGGRERIESPRSFCDLLEDLGLQYDFLSKEQMGSGKLSQYKVLILPWSRALSDKEAEAIKAFAATGGVVIAEGEAGVMDGHCRYVKRNMLAGVHRISTTSPIWRYREVRDTDEGRMYRREIETALQKVGIQPRFKVLPKGRTDPVGYEVVDFTEGKAEYLGLLQGREYIRKKNEDHSPQPVTIMLPGKCHVYSVRESRYIGFTSRIETTVEPAVAKLYALLPCKVERIEIGGVKGGYTTGTTVEYQIDARGNPAVALPHVFHVEIRKPGGQSYREYGGNLHAPDGRGQGSFRLALNDPKGIWTMAVTDVASGKRVEKRFSVK